MRNGSLIFLGAAATLASVLSVDVHGQRGGQPAPLPDGPGKELVSTACSRCHGLNIIANSWGYTREGWVHVFSSMVALPREESDTIADYLATHFPEKPGTQKAVLISGPTKSASRNGSLHRSVRGRTIRWPRPTAPSGGPGCTPMCSGGWIRRPAR